MLPCWRTPQPESWWVNLVPPALALRNWLPPWTIFADESRKQTNTFIRFASRELDARPLRFCFGKKSGWETHRLVRREHPQRHDTSLGAFLGIRSIGKRGK